MKENNIKLAQKGIDDALETIEALEKTIKKKECHELCFQPASNRFSTGHRQY